MRYTDPSGHVFFTILAGALIGAAVGAGVEIVSQKVIEKKKEVDWKSVGYEAAVGAVGGAIGGVFGKAGSVIGATKKGVAKMVAKTVVKAGVSEAAGGFLEDAGRQLFVEGKGMKQLDLGRLFRTAGIAGLTGMLGSVFGMLPDLLSDYRMETVTKTVTRVKTVNKCKNNRIDCPNHPNYPVIVDRYQEVVTVPEFVYVGKEGAENAAKGAAGRLDDDVAGMVARKESPLDQVKGWFQESAGTGREGGIERHVNGQRTSKFHILTDSEIDNLKKEIREIGADENFFRFNEGSQTGYVDKTKLIMVKGDVLPDKYSSHPRDRMSSKAALAHEYYGHKYFDDLYGKRNPRIGAWNDEFRASYNVAINAPNLGEMDRMYLMADALERAKEAGVKIKMTAIIKRILYGY